MIINKRSPERSDVPCLLFCHFPYFFFKNFQPILANKGILIQVETKALREVMYIVFLSASSFLVSIRAAFCRFNCSVNGGLVNVVTDDSGPGQRMSQEVSEGKVGGSHSR